MIERIKRLSRYEKGILLLMAVLLLSFAAVYAAVTSRVGFAYRDAILAPAQEDGRTVYSGRIQGQAAQFTVSPDGAVVFQCGEHTYGPYTAIEDPTAIPKDDEGADQMTGVELRRGDNVLFRGGVLDAGGICFLYNEDGTLEDIGVSVVTGQGLEIDEHGRVVDPMEPSVSAILKLMAGPELTHKGQWIAWFAAAFLCALNALSMLFADELFRWHLAFRIRDAQRAEPSDWELMGRAVGYAALTVMALVLFITGLQ